MDFRIRLRDILRNLEDPISMYGLAKELNMRVDPMLERILEIQQEYKAEYKNNMHAIMHGKKDFMQDFMSREIIDLGMLVQHKIVEIANSLRDKHNTVGHQMFFDQWLLHRGY